MITTNAGLSLGQTYYGETATVPTTYNGETIRHEGKVVYVSDKSVAANGSASSPLSGQMVKARVVRNVSGITLEARRACVWAANYRLRRVDGYTSVTGQEIAGFVDPHLAGNSNGGVRNHDLFLLIDPEGPVEGLTDLAGGANNSFAEGARLGALTAASSQATTAGRVRPVSGTLPTDATGQDVAHNSRAKAHTARTTAETNAAVRLSIV